MNRPIVRINSIELKGFKNINFGIVEMPSAFEKEYFSKKADILGIYGQNGSGKTAVIEAMEIVQKLLMGQSLSSETVNYISKEHNNCTIKVKFVIETLEKTVMADYCVQILRSDDGSFTISKECLGASVWNGEKFDTRKSFIEYDSSSESPIFTPIYRYDDVSRVGDNKVNLSVAKKISQKDKSSFIFGNDGRSLFLALSDSATSDYGFIIDSLSKYAYLNLFVISNAHSGTISMNIVLPFAFRLEDGHQITKGEIPVRLDMPSVIGKEEYEIIKRIIDNMNLVLNTIIPGLSIGIHDFGDELLNDGSEGKRIQLISKRGNVIIPLKLESEGIIKIISILNVLMCLYNDPSMCLFIDELDAGIYEYLLGELLCVFEKSAKGQLVFTSHNLRALEMLNKKSIIFSTTNPNDRYIRLQNVKSNNNLRAMYLKTITLGGQKEEVYSETDSVEIGRAFRRAGKAVRDGEEN